MLSELELHKDIGVFDKPVTEDIAPGYTSVIKVGHSNLAECQVSSSPQVLYFVVESYLPGRYLQESSSQPLQKA